MDRCRSMIVWLLVFGLIGILYEVEAFDAPSQAVAKSVRVKKDVSSKKLGNIGTETRKNAPNEEQVHREQGAERNGETEEQRRERAREAALEAEEMQRWARIRELRARQRQQIGGGLNGPRRPPQPPRSNRSYKKTFFDSMDPNKPNRNNLEQARDDPIVF